MPDCLQELIKELQVEGFTVPLYDADAVALWRTRCAQVLAAIPDPEARASQAVNFALGVALRRVPSAIVLSQFEEGGQP
jgi:hypothetical protein